MVERTTFNLLGHGFIYYLVLCIFLLSLYLLSCVSFIRIFVVVVNAFLIFKTSTGFVTFDIFMNVRSLGH